MTNKQFQLLFYAVRFMYPDCMSVSARLPLAISKLETGNWTAPRCVLGHNLFGMTAPSSRETTATNAKSGKVATFSDYFDSMRDFFLWCRCYALTDDVKLQANITGLHYNTNPKYPGSVDAIVHQLDTAKEYLPAALFSWPAAGAAAGLTVAGIYQALQAIFGED